MWCKSAVQILYEHWGVYSLFRGGKEWKRLCKCTKQNHKDDSVTKGCNQNSQKVYRKHILLF